jgi:myo-inositol-1(or 4)-monophosphatase
VKTPGAQRRRAGEMNQYEKELEIAVRAVREAGSLVKDSYAMLRGSDVREKHTNDLVTIVDMKAQDTLISRIRGSFTEDFIVAEEHMGSEVNEGIDPRRARRWFMDPLDGTTNYIHAFPMFAVSVALESEGRLVVGVTYDPLRDELFHAVRGGGAFLNGRPIHVSSIDDRRRTLLGTGFPFRAHRYLDDYLATFRFFFAHARGVRRAGSATLDLAYVAAGRLDAFWELTLSPWDMAAGVVLIEEAGGRVTDFFGGVDFLQTGHIVAGNGRFHDWMLEAIQKVFPPGRDYTLREE